MSIYKYAFGDLIKISIISVSLFFIFGVFRYHPNFSWVLPVGLLYSLLASFFIILSLLRNRFRFYKIEIYFIFILTLIMLISSGTAYINYNQPFWIGLAAQRNLLLLVLPFLILILLKNQKININHLEHAFLFMAWLNLFFNLIFIALVDINDLGSKSPWIIYKGIEDGSNRYNLPNAFTAFGGVYYFIKFIYKRSYSSLIASSMFLGYLFSGNMSRISIFAFLITVLIFLFYSRRSKIVLRKNVLILSSFIILILIGSFILNYQAYIQKMAYFYQPLYAVLGMSDLVNDASSSVRLVQFDAIKDTFFNNFIFGNGFLSNQWRGGFSQLNAFFIPQDLGVIGIIWVYGFFGLFIISIQYFFAFRIFNRIHKNLTLFQNKIFILSIIFVLIIALISNISIGVTAFGIERTATYLFILYFAYFQTCKNYHERARGSHKIE